MFVFGITTSNPWAVLLFADVVHFRFKTNRASPRPRSAKVVVAPRPPVSKHFDVFGTGCINCSVLALSPFAVRVIRRAPCRQMRCNGRCRGFRVGKISFTSERTKDRSVVNIFGFPLAHRKPMSGIEWRGVVRRTALPVGGDRFAFIMARDLYVGHLIVGHDVCLQSCKIASACFDDPA